MITYTVYALMRMAVATSQYRGGWDRLNYLKTELSLSRQSWNILLHTLGKLGNFVIEIKSSSFHMHVMNHNWSTTKQRLHPQSVAEISRHSVLSGGQYSTMWNIVWVCKSPFPSAGTVVSLFCAKTVQQRPIK